VLEQQLRGKWHTRECAMPIQPTMTFAPEGLVLGAGTVLLQTDGPRQLQSLRGQEARLLALLSAFRGRLTAPSALLNIGRAAKAWREGDNCLAYIYLAHTSLSRPQDLQSAAYRLEMAQCAMKHGASPRAVFKALRLKAHYIDAVEKFYNPEEPRIPAGSGRTSGEWTGDAETGGEDAESEGTGGNGTQVSSLLGRTSPPPASFLGALDARPVRWSRSKMDTRDSWQVIGADGSSRRYF
jgi:hypothetical protein